MVNLNDLYTAIRDALNADATFSDSIGGSNKIFIGRDLPNSFISPALQITGMTDTLMEPADISNLIIRTNAYALGELSGTVPLATLSTILESVYQAIDDKPLTLTGGHVYVICVETRDADCTRDFDYDAKPSRYLMGIEWRIIAR
jgi:hypothetical protein